MQLLHHRFKGLPITQPFLPINEQVWTTYLRESSPPWGLMHIYNTILSTEIGQPDCGCNFIIVGIGHKIQRCYTKTTVKKKSMFWHFKWSDQLTFKLSLRIEASERNIWANGKLLGYSKNVVLNQDSFCCTRLTV